MKRKQKKLLTKIISGLVVIIALIYNIYDSNNNSDKQVVTLVKCVDGDTAWFKINNKNTKVRFLYIDTPESTKTVEPYGIEASNYVKQQLTNASKIEIEYNNDGDRTDKYNRALVWVFVDNELLQEKIAANGYCKKYYDYGYNYKYKSTIIKANNQAKSKRLGIYKKELIN